MTNTPEAGRADTPPAAMERPSGTRRFTTVHTLFCAGHHNHRVLLGVPEHIEIAEQFPGVTCEIYSFACGSRFVLDLWSRNSYGTIQWRCFVCEAVEAHGSFETVPRVSPGARILLHTTGAAQSRLFLAWLAALVGTGVDPVSCPSETFEAAHFRLQGSRADRTATPTLSGLPFWP